LRLLLAFSKRKFALNNRRSMGTFQTNDIESSVL
jgi:hypothetical protein